MYKYENIFPSIKQQTYEQLLIDASEYIKNNFNKNLTGLSLKLDKFPDTFHSSYFNLKYKEISSDLSAILTELNNLYISLNQFLILSKSRIQANISSKITLDSFSSYQMVIDNIEEEAKEPYVKRDFNLTQLSNIVPEKNNFWFTEFFFLNDNRELFTYYITLNPKEFDHKYNTLIIKSIDTCRFYYKDTLGDYHLIDTDVYNINLKDSITLKVEAPVTINEGTITKFSVDDYSYIYKDVYPIDIKGLNIDFDIEDLKDTTKSYKIFNENNYEEYKYKASLGAFSIKAEYKIYEPVKDIILEQKPNYYKNNKQLSDIILEVDQDIPDGCAITYYVDLDGVSHIINPSNQDYAYFIINNPYNYLISDSVIDLSNIELGGTKKDVWLYSTNMGTGDSFKFNITTYEIRSNDIIIIRYTPTTLIFKIKDNLNVLNYENLKSSEDNIILEHYPYINIYDYDLPGIEVINNIGIKYRNQTKYTNKTPSLDFLLKPNSYTFTHVNNQILINDAFEEEHNISYSYYFDKIKIKAVLTNGSSIGKDISPVINSFNIKYYYGHYQL